MRPHGTLLRPRHEESTIADRSEQTRQTTHSRSVGFARSLVIVALFAIASTYANIAWHAAADHASGTAAIVSRLDGYVRDESDLQWRILASEGAPQAVVKQIGDLRHQEDAELRALTGRLAKPTVNELRDDLLAYHSGIDSELSLLNLGQIQDALRLEDGAVHHALQTMSAALAAARGDRSGASARLHATANLVLVLTMLGLTTLVAILLWRIERQHRKIVHATEDMLGREREAREAIAESEERVRYQARHDPLTGLANRLLFSEQLEGMASGPADALTCIVFVDIDSFKQINDRHGHNVGDVVLQTVAQRLQHCTRDNDLAARLGGDEFVVVAQVRDEASARRLADRVINSISGDVRVGETMLPIKASVGVAWGPLADSERLLHEADLAMYRSKNRAHASYADGATMTTDEASTTKADAPA